MPGVVIQSLDATLSVTAPETGSFVHSEGYHVDRMILEFIIETRDLTFRYDGSGSPSLDGVTFGIRKGVKTVILGANGAGKSTLFYQFNAVFRPEKGQVLFGGEPVSYRRKGIRRLRTRIAVVLQNPDDQVFGQTVEADVAYGPTNLGLSKEEVFRRVDEALFQTGMDDLREKNVLQLSYGQRKRLALAGALAMRPEVLVMDEPTAGLDPQMAIEVMELAEQLHNRGTDVIISTHDVDLAYSWADDIHVLLKGRVIYSGDPEGFYSDPGLVYSARHAAVDVSDEQGPLGSEGDPVGALPQDRARADIQDDAGAFEPSLCVPRVGRHGAGRRGRSGGDGREPGDHRTVRHGDEAQGVLCRAQGGFRVQRIGSVPGAVPARTRHPSDPKFCLRVMDA